MSRGGRWLVGRITEQWRAGGRRLDAALAPFELAYRAASGAYHAAYDAGHLPTRRAPVPVASVGNLVVGGAGKTPVAAWLAASLRRRGTRPAVLHRGYGGGDEPALHRRWNPDVPVYVGRDRAASARKAAADGRTVVILDDGFQHRRLARELDVVLVPAESWTERPRLLPRGPWREAPGALVRGDVVAVTRKIADVERARAVADAVGRYAPEAAVVRIGLLPRGWRRWGGGGGAGVDGAAGGTANGWEGGAAGESERGIVAGAGPRGEVVAVVGVARPDAFVANARVAGAKVADVLRYGDHHRYRAEDAERIRRRADGRPLVTTEKDAIKLGRLAADLDLWVLEQEVRLEAGAEALERWLDGLVG